MSDAERIYRNWTQPAMWLFAVFLLALGVLVASTGAVVQIALGVLWSVFAVWSAWKFQNDGCARQTSEAFWDNLWSVRWRRWKWDEIDHFEGHGRRVILVPRTHGRIPLIGVQQGQRLRWDGGETRDIVRELNEQLRLHVPPAS